MTLVLFGATGDLAKRKIYPALYNLYEQENLPSAISIVGTGRDHLTDQDFQNIVEDAVITYSRQAKKGHIHITKFFEKFRYVRLDATKEADFDRLLERVVQREEEMAIPQNRMFYLSVAPQYFDVIALNIASSGLGVTNGWRKLIIEKPFGHDLTSARVLNESLRQFFAEEEIYRIDHYLGKSMVQNLQTLGFVNPVLKAIWNRNYIANVQITASETIGVESRADYYDQVGAIRDMFQNHMLQLLMMTAMQLPKRMHPEEVRKEKRKVMEVLRPLKKERVKNDVIRGQYGHGDLDGTKISGYVDERGVAQNSMCDTFIAARLWIDDENWKGVPFYLRTGKRMKEKSTRIVIEFKNLLKEVYRDTEPNLLVLEINPNESVMFQFNRKNHLGNEKYESFQTDFSAKMESIPEAYELLILDAMKGDSTFFAHWKEVELAWEWIQPVLDAFAENKVPLHHYRAGSVGPEASNQLLMEDEFKWW